MSCGDGSTTTIECCRCCGRLRVYVDGVRLPGTHTPESALDEVRRRGSGFVWLGLFAPTFEQMTAIAQTYGLHELVAEDSVHAHQRPKLEQYDKVTVLVMRTAHYLSPTSIRTADDIVETGEILAAVGSDFIVTVRHARIPRWRACAPNSKDRRNTCKSGRGLSCTR